MSLDVYLKKPGVQKIAGPRIFVREDGATKEISRAEWDARHPGREPVVVECPDDGEEVYSRNITHNLGRMADAAGLYAWLWRPEEVAATKAAHLIEPLRVGLERLLADPAKFMAFNPDNGWGSYEGLVSFVGDYLEACEADADVEVSR